VHWLWHQAFEAQLGQNCLVIAFTITALFNLPIRHVVDIASGAPKVCRHLVLDRQLAAKFVATVACRGLGGCGVILSPILCFRGKTVLGIAGIA